MKKIYSILCLIIACVFMCVGCSCGKGPSITFSHDSISVNLDSVYVINVEDIEISNYKNNNFEIIIFNEDIAKLEGLTIRPKKEGQTKFRIQLKDDGTIYKDVKLIVTDIVFATEANIRKSIINVSINKEDAKYFNPLTLNPGCNEVPTLTFDRNIIDYDYKTGQIKPKKLGTTTVVVLFGKVNVSFVVNVIDTIYTQCAEIYTTEVFVGDSEMLNFSIFPSNANTYSFRSLTPDILDVDKSGAYTAKKAGIASVVCDYSINEDTQETSQIFEIYVFNKLNELNVRVLSSTDQICDYYLIENTYRLRLIDVSTHLIDRVSVSGNIEYSTISSDIDGIYIDFTFKNKEQTQIDVFVQVGSLKKISWSKNIDVTSISDASIEAKWTIYNLNMYSDQAYHLFLESGKPNHVKFKLKTGNLYIAEEYHVYVLKGGNKVLLEDNKFIAEVAGQFDIIFEWNNVQINQTKVIVE